MITIRTLRTPAAFWGVQLGAVALVTTIAGAAVGARYYVDCHATKPGDGTRRHPWSSLADANAVLLSPGDRLLLRRGTTCAGPLAPTGAGDADAPVVVGGWGRGSRPRIEGAPEDAVLLRNTSHMVLRDLEVTNAGPEARRRGVHVVADGEVVRDVTVRDLYVHDVDGDLKKDQDGSGGIQVDVYGGGRFEGLHIEGNRIEDVSRSGIFVVAGSGTRPPSGEPWPEASTWVVVEGNRLARLGGDGIVALGTVGAVLQDNVVSAGNLRGYDFTQPERVCNAGIWTFDANDTMIQRNEVFDMRLNGCDGTGFDVDYDQDGTIVQFNYSHDNEGGFILICTDSALRRAEVRFNLSVNDAAAATTAPCRFPEIGTNDGVRFYNNTIVGSNPLLGFEGGPIGQFFGSEAPEFYDNLFVATPPVDATFPCGDRCANNLFFGLPPSGTNAVTTDPRFRRPTLRGGGRRVAKGHRLRSRSPAIGAGVPVPGSIDVDYFGRRFDVARPSIGFHQPSLR
jgi:hypothetical protein